MLKILTAVGCILLAEYAYFFLRNGRLEAKDIFRNAVREYNASGTKAVIQEAVANAIEEHGNNLDKLGSNILDIVLKHRMCKLSTSDWRLVLI